MKRNSHFIWTIGLSLFVLFYFFEYNLFISILMTFFIALLSWICDIDINIINNIKKFNKKTFYLFYILTIPFIFLFKHRRITHAIWFPLLFFYLAEYIFIDYYFSIILRVLYLSLIFHIIEDMMTISGIRLFYPLGFKIRFAQFNTNSNIDYLVLNMIGFLILVLFFIFYLL